MPEIAHEEIRMPDWPDIEEFMAFCQESRIDGESMKSLLQLWIRWKELLQSFRITDGKKSWLAVWLPEEVEHEVDQAWALAPSRGFLCNALAQFLCMSAINERLPAVADAGCAPAPEPALALKLGLAEAGLEVENDTGLLKRRYAVVTWFPFRGGCEVCSLRENCPKGSGGSDFASMVLPGHERSGGE